MYPNVVILFGSLNVVRSGPGPPLMSIADATEILDMNEGKDNTNIMITNFRNQFFNSKLYLFRSSHFLTYWKVIVQSL